MEKLEDIIKPQKSDSFILKVGRGEALTSSGIHIDLSTLMDGFTPLMTVQKDGKEVTFVVDRVALVNLALSLFGKYKDDPEYSREVKRGGDEK